MLKKMILALSLCLCCFSTISVQATETPTEEVSAMEVSTEDDTSYEVADEEANPYVYFDEADAGGGMDYSDGISTEDKSEMPSKGCGFVTFIASVSTDIAADRVIMECYNMATYKDYGFNLYHINDYTTHAELPYGTYYIYTGGFYGDAANQYPIEKQEFEVKDGSNVVTFKIGTEDTSSTYVEEESTAVESIEEEDFTIEEIKEESSVVEATEVIEEPQESNNIISIVLTVIVWLGIIVAVILYIKKARES